MEQHRHNSSQIQFFSWMEVQRKKKKKRMLWKGGKKNQKNYLRIIFYLYSIIFLHKFQQTHFVLLHWQGLLWIYVTPTKVCWEWQKKWKREFWGSFLKTGHLLHWNFALISLGRLKTVGKAVSGRSQAGSSALLLKPPGKVLKILSNLEMHFKNQNNIKMPLLRWCHVQIHSSG